MSFIKTFSGKHFYYDRINKDDIVINDIAVSLSNICRFAGHLSHFYSVAQHAVLCSQLVPQEFAFEALMHDATEAYCQDIPAPLKRLLPDYKRMEEKIDAVIREKYGLPPIMSTPVKYADLIMLATERRDLGLDDGSFWPVLEGIPATEMFKVIPQAPGHAYGMFMERFNELSELRKMRMNVFEMEGFLRGRCVPRDLKVNETDAEYLVRKFDALEAKCAAQENKVIPVSTELPPANESVLLFDANGEGWLIGWRSLWYTWGQKETGEWQWTFQVGDLENVNITHWAVMPKAPEAGA